MPGMGGGYAQDQSPRQGYSAGGRARLQQYRRGTNPYYYQGMNSPQSPQQPLRMSASGRRRKYGR